MITWRDKGFSSYYGYLGDIEAVTVYWSSTRHPDGRMNVLESKLPLPSALSGTRYKSQDEAKEAANQIVADFVSYVNAHWT